ncbi:MAG: site-specific integrase [Polyangia bacterium]
MGDIIRKRKNGRDLGWYIRWVDSDGKRKQRASHQPTYTLARRMLLEIEARIARGQAGLVEPEPTSKLTVAELCDKWLAEFASPRIKDLPRYRSAALTSLRRILPQLGQVPVAQLSRAQVEKARDAVARKYRPNTVRATLRPLGTCLSWGVRQGLLRESPARGIELPQRERSMEYLSAAEAARLLAESEGQARQGGEPAAWSRAVAVALALRTGLRRGEIFGLRWQDLDLDAGRLTVARSYRLAPKSGKPRHLPIPSALSALLKEWRERCPQTAERLVCPVLFRGRWGMSSRRATHGLARLLRKAGCQPLVRGWHALRHTFASQFIMQGGNILTLQKLLGHADIGMTLVYSHLAPDFVAAELERLKY